MSVYLPWVLGVTADNLLYFPPYRRVFDKVHWKLHHGFKKGENLNASALSTSQMAPCDCAVVSLSVLSYTDNTQGAKWEE